MIQDKYLENDSGFYFGARFNSTVARSEGILKATADSINYLYENIVESYLSDTFEGVVQDYTLTTIKVKS